MVWRIVGDSSSYRIEIEQWVQFSQIWKLVGFTPFQTIFPFYSTYRERADSLIGSETKPAEQEPEKQKTTQNVTCFGSQERGGSQDRKCGDQCRLLWEGQIKQAPGVTGFATCRAALMRIPDDCSLALLGVSHRLSLQLSAALTPFRVILNKRDCHCHGHWGCGSTGSVYTLNSTDFLRLTVYRRVHLAPFYLPVSRVLHLHAVSATYFHGCTMDLIFWTFCPRSPKVGLNSSLGLTSVLFSSLPVPSTSVDGTGPGRVETSHLLPLFHLVLLPSWNHFHPSQQLSSFILLPFITPTGKNLSSASVSQCWWRKPHSLSVLFRWIFCSVITLKELTWPIRFGYSLCVCCLFPCKIRC